MKQVYILFAKKKGEPIDEEAQNIHPLAIFDDEEVGRIPDTIANSVLFWAEQPGLEDCELTVARFLLTTRRIKRCFEAASSGEFMNDKGLIND